MELGDLHALHKARDFRGPGPSTIGSRAALVPSGVGHRAVKADRETLPRTPRTFAFARGSRTSSLLRGNVQRRNASVLRQTWLSDRGRRKDSRRRTGLLGNDPHTKRMISSSASFCKMSRMLHKTVMFWWHRASRCGALSYAGEQLLP